MEIEKCCDVEKIERSNIGEKMDKEFGNVVNSVCVIRGIVVKDNRWKFDSKTKKKVLYLTRVIERMIEKIADITVEVRR